MKKLTLIIMLSFIALALNSCAMNNPATTSNNDETVVILHGIAANSSMMVLVENSLKGGGYKTLSITYPSQKMSISEIAKWLREEYLTDEFWDCASKVHFVTHSMGGLVAWQYLEDHPHKDKVGRVVMLAPPLYGSEVADFGAMLPFYDLMMGPSGKSLTTHNDEKPEPYYELGIIAGNIDGLVSVESTKTKGMKDHIVLPSEHLIMLALPAAHLQINYFLKNGRFYNDN